MSSELDLRPSPIAGQWYPANPSRLAESIDNYINAADLPTIEGEVIGVMTPPRRAPLFRPCCRLRVRRYARLTA